MGSRTAACLSREILCFVLQVRGDAKRTRAFGGSSGRQYFDISLYPMTAEIA